MDVLFFPVRNDCEILISVTRDFFLFQTLKKEIIAVVFVFSCIKLNLCTKYTYSVFFLLSDLNKHNTYTQTKEKKKTIDSIKAPPSHHHHHGSKCEPTPFQCVETECFFLMYISFTWNQSIPKSFYVLFHPPSSSFYV